MRSSFLFQVSTLVGGLLLLLLWLADWDTIRLQAASWFDAPVELNAHKPITVMLVIPTALIGVVFGHMALGLNMTMPSIVGMASLFGVVVNDSILLVVFIREARARRLPVPEAAKQAARARFRPILLTSITTVAGLTPLLLEKSLQAQILIPLAASLAFGLATATVAALFLVPAVFSIMGVFGWVGALEDERDELEESVVA